MPITKCQLQIASYKLLNDQKTSQSHLNSHTSLTPQNSILVYVYVCYALRRNGQTSLLLVQIPFIQERNKFGNAMTSTGCQKMMQFIEIYLTTSLEISFIVFSLLTYYLLSIKRGFCSILLFKAELQQRICRYLQKKSSSNVTQLHY